jgi:hypothetical protein
VRIWVYGEYRKKLILNVTLFVVRVWGGQYRKELILNSNVFVVKVGLLFYRLTYTECNSILCLVFGELGYSEELILNVTMFVLRFWKMDYM